MAFLGMGLLGQKKKKKNGTFGGILITVAFCLAGDGADSFHHSIWSQYLWSFSFLLRQMSDLLAQKRVFSFFGSKSHPLFCIIC